MRTDAATVGLGGSLPRPSAHGKRSSALTAAIGALLTCLALAVALGPGVADGPAIDRATGPAGDGGAAERAADTYADLPLSFVANRGQSDPRVRFEAQAAGAGIFLGDRSLTLAFGSAPAAARLSLAEPGAREAGMLERLAAADGLALKLRFVGARGDARPSGVDRSPGTISYFTGDDPSRWQRGLSTYAGVSYAGLWPGIDMRLHGADQRLKYEFTVAPGADPSRIALAYGGAESLSVAPDGALRIETARGTLRDTAPVTYQVVDGRRVVVESRYALRGESGYGFALGAHDPSRPLVIDPGLEYSTFLGGASGEQGNDIAVDASGSAYVAGYTDSSGFPKTGGTFQSTPQGAFVTKLSPGGQGLEYSAVIGGNSALDYATGIAVDDSGSAFVAGYTESSNFPTTSGALDTTYAGGDNFVLKLNPEGTDLDYSTYLGGSAGERSDRAAIAVDGAGAAYVAGGTFSSDFPTTAGAFQTAYDTPSGGFGGDAYVSKLSPNGGSLAYSTYLGGNVDEQAFDLALDATGAAYVTGPTVSPDFPTTPGAYDRTFDGSGLGNGDAFAAKLNPAGSSLSYSTFLGGDQSESGRTIAVDADGSAYVAGVTEGDYPTTAGAFDTERGTNTSSEGYLTKLAPAGDGLAYSTYLGGENGPDFLQDVEVDSTGAAHLTGQVNVSSTTLASDYPTTAGAFDTTYNGGADTVLTKVSPGGDTLAYSTFLGGDSNDIPYGLAVDASGRMYVTGFTYSGNFPTTPGSFDPTHNGGSGSQAFDAFATRLDPRLPECSDGQDNDDDGAVDHPADDGCNSPDDDSEFAAPAANLSIDKTDSDDPVTVGEEFDYTLSVINNGPDGADRVVIADVIPSSLELVSFPEECTFAEDKLECEIGEMGNGGTRDFVITVRPTEAGEVTNTATVAADSPGDPDSEGNSASQTTTVQPASTQRTLTVTNDGEGAGNVSSEPPGIDCGADCTGDYADGTEVTLTATPDPGSVFAGWSGAPCDDGTEPTVCRFIIDTDRSVSATFEREDGADLAIEKSDSQDPVEVRDGFVYTLGVENLGPSGANSVTVTDQLPASVEVISIPSECGRSESTVTCDLGEMGNGAQRSLDIIVQPQEQGTISNTAEVSSTTPDPNETNDSDTETTTVSARTQHTLTVTKDGSGFGTVTSDPAGIDCGADCTEDYDNGASIDVTATPDPGSEFAGWEGNCGEISGDTCFDVQMSEDQTVKATFNADAPQADLAITKADSPDPVAVGETLTYTLGVQNNGPAGTDNVVVTDALPASVETIDIPDECTQSLDTLTCELGEMGNGGSRELTVTVRPTEEGEITNAASVVHDTADPSEENNSTTESTTVTSAPPAERTLTVTKDGFGAGNVSSEPPGIDCGADCSEDYDDGTEVTLTATPDPGSRFVGWSGAPCDDGTEPTVCRFIIDTDRPVMAGFELIRPDVSIVKSDSADPVTVGEPFMYTLRVENLGPEGTADPVVTDRFPDGLDVESSPPECDLVEGEYVCNLDELGNGATKELIFTVSADSAGTVTNTAQVSSAGDPDASNDSSTQTTEVRTAPTPQRTLTVTKGGDGTGTVTSSPAGIDCGEDCSEPYDENTMVDLTATPDPGSVFAGWSGACAGQPDFQCTVTMDDDQTATATFDEVPEPQADLSIEKTESKDPVSVDEPFDYILTVRNAGPDGASDVLVTDVVPNSIEVESLPEGCTFAESTIQCELGEMGNGGERTLTIGVRATEAGEVQNTGFVTASSPADPVSENNSESETTTVQAGPTPQRTLTVLKGGDGAGTVTSDPPGIDCGSDCSEAFDEGTEVTLTATSAPGSVFAGWSGAPCNEPSEPTVCTFSIDTDRQVTATFDQLAQPSADLSIIKEDTDDPVAVDERFDYTFTVRNLGPDGADGVRITDELPPSIEVESLPEECTVGEGTLVCLLGEMGNGGERTITVGVSATEEGTVTNLAQVSSNDDDPFTPNDSDSEITTVGGQAQDRTLTVEKRGSGSGTVTSAPAGIDCGDDCTEAYEDGTTVTLTANAAPGSRFDGWSRGNCSRAEGNTCELTMDADKRVTPTFTALPPGTDLAITKTDSSGDGVVEFGEIFDYLLRVENLGADADDEVTVLDELPESVEVIYVPPGCGVDEGNRVDCDLGRVAGGESRLLTITVRPVAGENVLENIATVSGAEDDPVFMNNSDSIITFAGAGSSRPRTLTVTKDGAGSGTVTSTPAGINCGSDCDGTYPEGSSVTLTATPSPGSSFAGWAGDCAGTTDNTCTVTMNVDRAARATFIPSQADLVIAKSDSLDPVEVNEPFEYTLAVLNTGPDTAEDVVVTDDLPAALEVIEIPDECVRTQNSLRCQLGDLADEETRNLTVRVRATEAGSVENTARVFGSTPDPVAGNDSDSETTTVNSPPAGSRTLTVTKDGTGTGTVSSFPGGIDCGDDCSQSYADGTTVTLTADPAPGSAFAGWAGDCAEAEQSRTCELTMDANRNASATFNNAPPADLAIDKSDSPDPVIVGNEFDYTLEAGNLGPNTARDVTVGDTLPAGVELVDAPASCTNDENLVLCDLGDIPPNEAFEVTIRVRATAVGTVENTAEVAAAASSDPVAANNTDTESTTVRPEQRTLIVTKGGAGEGTVTSSPAGIDCGPDCTESYDEGSAVTLTATPAPGSVFVRWEPACSGAERNTCDVVLDEDTTVGAIFEPAQAGADLEITKSDSQDPVELRERFRYTLRVENFGRDTAAGVQVVDDIPEGVSVVSLPNECLFAQNANRRVLCFLGSMPAGSNRSLDLLMEPTRVGSVTNTATVASNTPDPQQTNNVDSETTTVVKGNDRAIARWPLNIRDFDVQGPFTPDVGSSSLTGRDAQATLVPGRFRNAFSLDGEGDGFQAGPTDSSSVLEPPDAQGLSVVTWVRSQPGGPAPGPNEAIVAKGGRNCGSPSYGLSTGENGGLEFSTGLYYSVNQGFFTFPRFPVIRTPAIAPASVWDGRWHAVTAVYGAPNEDGSRNIGLWVDGRRVAGAEIPEAAANETYLGINYLTHGNDRQLTVGRIPQESCTQDRSLNGQLDDVRIYGEALDRREIRFLHNPNAQTAPFLDDDTAPVNTARPEISGTPTPGSELSCTQGGWTGNDSGPVTYTTVWERAPRATKSEDDQSWAPIDGAVGPRYTVQDIDLGSRVRCRVTRTDAGGTTDASSRSLRVDAGPPENVVAPRVVGIPQFENRVTCEPGQWTNGPGPKDFSYQWISAGRVVQGATNQTYVPRQRRVKGGFRVVNPDGDGDRFISCQVTARNDVGSTLHNSQVELAVDDVPIFPSAPGAPVIQAPGETGVSAAANVKVGEAVTCSNGRIGGQDVNWVDGYGDKDGYGTSRGFSLSFEWFRQGTLIPGESGRTYTVRFDDLGRDLTCRITNSNPLGSAQTAISITKRINIPEGERDSTVYQVGGINQADPMNLLALSDDYRRIVQEESRKRLTAGLKRVEEDCRARSDIPAGLFRPANPADIEGVQRQIDDRARCQIILRGPLTVRVVPEGVRYIPPLPAACSIRFAGDFPLCPNLRIQVAPIDPRNPPATDTELAAKLAPVTPDRFIWDLDRDGRTDAVCPGSAPVLRTIYNPGNWNPRVVIVDKGSEKLHFTDTFFTAPGKKTVNTVVRSNQVRVCATAFDPPPNPEKTPCISEGQVGRVRLEGDLCPIDVREINPLDFDNFDGQIYQMLLAQSEERLKGEGVQTASARRDPDSTEPIWLDLGEARQRKGTFFAGIAQSIPGFDQVSATYVNNAASLSGVRPGSTLPDLSGNLKQKLNSIPSFEVPKAGFAMNQVYIARGDAMKLNGTTIDPLGDSAALIVPSDVKNALGSVQSLSVSARNAGTYLGGKAAGIPLAEGGNLQQKLSDTPTQALSEAERRLRAELDGVEQRLRDARGQLEAQLRQKEQELRQRIRDEAKKLGQDVLRESNLDQLVQKLQGAADKLDLGPFKLRGTAQVKVENDGTASLTAKAVLPGLKVGVGGSTEASAEVTLRADPSGKVKLGGLRIKPPGIAYLGGVSLNDLDLIYDGGLDVKGKILFPPPVAAGIAINRFKLGPKGEFQILDVDFLAGAGGGIQVTPGIFITKLGAKLNLLDDIVGGNATVSVGPGVGGGCPTVGLNAAFDVHFAEQYYLDARGVVQLACIDLVNIDFHADQSGLVTLDGRIDQKLGPLFIKVALGAAIKLPNWQATASGSGGIRIPVVGTVSAGFKLVLSNIGLAGCATLKLPVVPDVSGGAAVRFRGGRPPISPVELIANLRFFVGCDLSEYYSVVQRAVASGSQAGSTSFVIPRGAGPSLLSIEGAGEAPRVQLRSPSGRVFDFTDATSDGGKTIGPARAAVIEPEDRTVVFLGRAEAGTWTAEVAEGSTRIVRVQRADMLPKPEATARVTGRGTRRTLRYRVKPIDGQKVRLVEMARGGRKVLRTVQRGGRGQVSFRVSESNSRRRRIVAEVIQDDLPRENLTVARYQAPNPRVGRARRIRIRRRGGGAVITWQRASFSRGHEVIVRTGTGRRYVIRRRRAQRLAIRRVRPKEAVVVRIVAFSPGGRRGKYVTARLAGSMRVGSVRKATIRHPNVIRQDRARQRRAVRRRARERSRTRARREGSTRRRGGPQASTGLGRPPG